MENAIENREKKSTKMKEQISCWNERFIARVSIDKMVKTLHMLLHTPTCTDIPEESGMILDAWNSALHMKRFCCPAAFWFLIFVIPKYTLLERIFQI